MYYFYNKIKHAIIFNTKGSKILIRDYILLSYLRLWVKNVNYFVPQPQSRKPIQKFWLGCSRQADRQAGYFPACLPRDSTLAAGLGSQVQSTPPPTSFCLAYP